MALLKGIEVILYQKTLTGKDAFNREMWEERPVKVQNVLVSPLSQSGEDIISELSLNGKKALYQLAIPKGDTHTWEDATVEFFGEKWRTVSFSTMGIDNLIPLDWNKKVVVERYG